MLPYHTGVLEDAPTGPGMVLMPGGRPTGRSGTPFPSPGGDIEGDPVGTAGEALGGHEARGDKADAYAAEELFKGVYPKLAGWVRRLVDDDDTAHEIASEAFVRLLARWTRVDSPQSYLYMIATNLVRDHWRKTERERRAMRSVTAGASAEPLAYPDQDVDVRNLLASLPDRNDDIDGWLSERIDPLPPPPGTFELIKRRARRRKYRRLAVGAGVAAVIAAAAGCGPQGVSLPVVNSGSPAAHVASGPSPSITK